MVESCPLESQKFKRAKIRRNSSEKESKEFTQMRFALAEACVFHGSNVDLWEVTEHNIAAIIEAT